MRSIRQCLFAFFLMTLAVCPVGSGAQEAEPPAPCTAPEYRQFDFWLGEWEVRNPAGDVVGTNTVTRRLSGCLLTEEWTSARGGEGFSINYYDDRNGTWTQTYRDSTGNIATWPDLVGGLRDGAMVLESGPDTQPMTRWIWTKVDDDKVRQMAEASEDGGQTWKVVWDSYYIRRQ